ncbi:hypothetical protein Dcar01_00904 [Deinococcus carri]|uniref:HNH endonuclease n=1 Tax=Deinococcus carri TaxID=1211323 RepID=A0ABP9W491_9DEIO
MDVKTLAPLILPASACAYCQGPLDTIGCAVDHIIPLSRSGTHKLGIRATGDLLPGEFQT